MFFHSDLSSGVTSFSLFVAYPENRSRSITVDPYCLQLLYGEHPRIMFFRHSLQVTIKTNLLAELKHQASLFLATSLKSQKNPCLHPTLNLAPRQQYGNAYFGRCATVVNNTSTYVLLVCLVCLTAAAAGFGSHRSSTKCCGRSMMREGEGNYKYCLALREL